MTRSPRRVEGPTLIKATGRSYFPLAFVARLPYAMMVVGVLTLVVAARDSIELGGINSAVVGIGTALFGPFIGAAADRFGQRSTLLIAAIVNSVSLAALTWVAFSSLSVWWMFLGAFMVGASAPQISPMSRARLVGIIATALPTSRRPRVLSTVFAYESAADEVIFVFGPVIVGLLATTLGVWAPMIGAAVLTIIFVSAFAIHRSSVPPVSAAERAATLGPASELRRPKLVVVVVGIFAVGLFFGSMLTSLTAFMQDRGQPESAGLLYGIMGVGSAFFAIGMAFVPVGFSLRARWLVSGIVIIAGTISLQFASDIPGMSLALAISGIGIGPVLVTLYSFGADRSPEGRSATVMAMLGSGLIVGQALGAASTGILAAQVGTDASMWLPLGSALLITLSGVVNFWLTPARREPSRRTAQIPTIEVSEDSNRAQPTLGAE